LKIAIEDEGIMVLVLEKTEGHQLNEAIENLRMEMMLLGDKLGLAHPSVQHCSEQLDLLLLEYYLRHK
jgi:hypothetical protein